MADADDAAFACPWCEAQITARGDFAKHINGYHAPVTQEAVAVYGLCVHEACGKVFQGPLGIARHVKLGKCVPLVTTPPPSPQGYPPLPRQPPPPRGPPPGANGANGENPGNAEGAEQPPHHGAQLDDDNGLAEFGGNTDSLRAFIAVSKFPAPVFANLHHAQREAFTETVRKAADAYVAAPSEELLLRILLLPKLGLASNIGDTRRHLALVNNGHYGQLLLNPPRRRPQPARDVQEAPIDEALPALTDREKERVGRLIGNGDFRKAATVVHSKGSVAPICEGTVAAMRAKHPAGATRPFGERTGPVPPRIDTAENREELPRLVDRMDRQTSPGISGWSPALMQLCKSTPRSGKSFMGFLMLLAKQMLTGTAPGRTLLCAARIIPLKESLEATKIRPIACGELFYRVLARFILKTVSLDGALRSEQLGVGTPGGVEPIVHLLQREFEASLDDDGAEDRYAYLLDFRNAFNNASRVAAANAVHEFAGGLFRFTKWGYGAPTPLVMGDGRELAVIPSAEGFRQGDPLAPLLFSLVLRAKLPRLKDAAGDTALAYLDDTLLISSNPNALPRIETIFAPAGANPRPADGLILNPEKTRLISMRDLAQSDTGLEVLGSMVGTVEARRAFLRHKMDELRPSLHRLRSLPSQQALLLLRLCFAPKLVHLLRSMVTTDLQEELRDVDELFFGTLDFLRRADPTAARPEVVTRVYSLPVSKGGLGVASYEEIRAAAYDSSRGAADRFLADREIAPAPPHAAPPNLLPDAHEEAAPARHVQSQKALADQIYQEDLPRFLALLDDHRAAAFQDLGSKIGCAWLRAQPRGNHRCLSDGQVAAALQNKTLQSDQQGREVCTRCGGFNTVNHFECCPHNRVPIQYRHNKVRDLLLAAIRESGRTCSTEPPVHHNPLRSADLRIGTTAGGNAVDPQFGLVDIKVQTLLASEHDARRHEAQDQTAEEAPDTQYPVAQRRAWNGINAVLNACRDRCRQEYAGLHLPPPGVVPIVISSAGTLQTDFRTAIKALVPAHARNNLFIDISLCLLRARATAYTWGMA